jgi:cytochrome P450
LPLLPNLTRFPLNFALIPTLFTADCGNSILYKGQQVVIVLAAANRSPAQFVNPDKFDIARKDNPHSAFSHGIHYCLGAPLVRVEAQIALNTLLRRMPNLRLQAEDLE